MWKCFAFYLEFCLIEFMFGFGLYFGLVFCSERHRLRVWFSKRKPAMFGD